MSSATHRISWRQASGLAYKVECQLRPACERIQVAGSVRRRSPDCGDIEFVLVPQREAGLFGAAQPGDSLVDVELARLVERGQLRPGRCDGERQKHYVLTRSGAGLELFLVTPATWGVQLAIRTGPRQFSAALVTTRDRGGRLNDAHVVYQGRVRPEDAGRWHLHTNAGNGRPKRTWRPDPLAGGEPLATPEEADFLQLAGGWIDPEVRP